MEIRTAGAVAGVTKVEPSLWEKLQKTIATVSASVGGKVKALGETVTEKVTGATEKVVTVAEKVTSGVKDTAVKAVTAVKETGTAVMGGIKSTARWIKYLLPLGAVSVGLVAMAKLKG
ncbi:hypothetical protein SDC9_166006 [bioreactor metagenome]|uniref:Uncharacterized protein n=1 Tax=bioreactor metagenome TaxID=1076179 RepID=A0A645FW18_9ZZZZ